MDKIDLSLIIPCYNEGSILNKNLQEIAEFLERTKYSWELIIIDDQSLDETPQIIKTFTERYPETKVLFHKKNIGRGGTVSEGIRLAKGGIVGFIDIDLEVPVSAIMPLIIEIEKGADIATAKRIYDMWKVSFMRYLSSIGYIYLRNKLLPTNLMDTETGCKFFNRKRILPILKKTENVGWFWDTEIMVIPYFLGYKIAEIPSLLIKKKEKKSTVKLLPDTIKYLYDLVKFRKRVKKEFIKK